MEDGVDGAMRENPVVECAMLRNGDVGRRIRLFVETPRLGELLRSR
jgi:hypothetical protein